MSYAKNFMQKLNERYVGWKAIPNTSGLKGGENVRFKKGHPQEYMIGIVIDVTSDKEITVLLGNSTRTEVAISDVELAEYGK